MRPRVWLIISIVCLSILFLAGSLGATSYLYQDLTLQGLQLSPTGANPDHINAINDSGWIVGSYYDASILAYLPFVWRPGLGRTTLPLGDDGYWGEANGLNNAGRIVGERYISMTTLMPHYPCLWSDPLQAPVDLYVFDATKNSNAYGINDGGFIAGESVFASSGGYTRGAWWAPTQQQTSAVLLLTLGGNTASGRSINNSKLIAGTAANASGQDRACLWVPIYPPQDLVPAPQGGTFGYGVAINNKCNVVGRADLTGIEMGHAFFWDYNTGTWQDMCPLDYESNPCGISDSDQVAGYVMSNSYATSVFFWTPKDGKQDLNNLVTNLPNGVTLQTAAAISRSGLITGFDSQGHPYLLKPIIPIYGPDLLLD
jgi:uncharacterized membrane protein